MSAALELDGDLLRLKGAVTIATATALYRDLQRHLGNGRHLPEVVTVDCSGVGTADSTALALLIEAQRQLSAHGKRLNVVGLRQQLASLAQIYGVAWLLSETE